MGSRTGLVTAVLAVPVALLAALPSLGWQLTGALPGLGDSPRAAQVEHHRLAKVRVTGVVDGKLTPGISVPVLVTIRNPNHRPVRMNRIRVKIVSVRTSQTAAQPCTKADFRVRQMPRRVLRLPAGRTTDLAGLGVPAVSWPRLTMLNRPVNQDGCKDAVVRLRFKARGLRR
jgi:hypothetical protein